jgi:putative Mg2+ transporter-C (MgtC) family protein
MMPPVLIDATNDLQLLLKLLISLGLCTIIGYDRESNNRPAGLRTHVLVGLGSTLFVLLGLILIEESNIGDGSMRYDPVRILEAVITGIAFLGAGTIFFSRGENTISGLTTAASLWLTAGIGIAVALGHLVLAVGCTLMAMLVLNLFNRIPVNKKSPP